MWNFYDWFVSANIFSISFLFSFSTSHIFQSLDVVLHFPPLYYSDFGTNISVEAFFFRLLCFIKRQFLFYIFFLSPFPFSLITSLTHNAVTTLFLVNPSLPVHACFRRNQHLFPSLFPFRLSHHRAETFRSNNKKSTKLFFRAKLIQTRISATQQRNLNKEQGGFSEV